MLLFALLPQHHVSASHVILDSSLILPEYNAEGPRSPGPAVYAMFVLC